MSRQEKEDEMKEFEEIVALLVEQQKRLLAIIQQIRKVEKKAAS